MPAPPTDLETVESAFGDEAGTVDLFLDTDERPTAAAIFNRAACALLLRMDGPHAGAVFVLKPPGTIGRHPSNSLHIDDDGISRFHARISRDEQGFLIEDLDSRNGTFVGGNRIEKKHRLTDGDELTLGSRVAFRLNITDTLQERVLRRLYDSSTRDALTGAYNRSHFDQRLREELAYATRHLSDLSIVLLDIDHFKRINDAYGHHTGDIVLKELVALSHRSLRIEDVFARFGGEEFVVILRGTSLNGARQLGERLRGLVAQARIRSEDRLIAVTISAGCASMLCCTVPVRPDELVRIADRRLYLAKSGGRNRVVTEG